MNGNGGHSYRAVSETRIGTCEVGGSSGEEEQRAGARTESRALNFQTQEARELLIRFPGERYKRGNE